LLETDRQDIKAPHKWRPIEHIAEEVIIQFRDRELEALCQAWTEQRGTLGQEESIRQFNAELKREWAIETGTIEGISLPSG
jgi:hypothetical protein